MKNYCIFNDTAEIDCLDIRNVSRNGENKISGANSFIIFLFERDERVVVEKLVGSRCQVVRVHQRKGDEGDGLGICRDQSVQSNFS